MRKTRKSKHRASKARCPKGHIKGAQKGCGRKECAK